MTWTFEVTGKRRDGFSPVVSIRYTDGETEQVEDWGGAYSDDAIAEHARQRIVQLDGITDALKGVTIGPGIVPDAPKADPKLQELLDAQNAAALAIQKADLRKKAEDYNDPAVTAAVARVDAAEADLQS